MSINGLTDGGALPAIEAMARFTAARQRLTGGEAEGEMQRL